MGLTKELFLQRCLVKPGKDFTLIDEVVNELIEPAFNKLRDELYAAPAVEDQKVLDHQVEQTRQQDMVRLVRQGAGTSRGKIVTSRHPKGRWRDADFGKYWLENRPMLEKRVEDECLEITVRPLEFRS